MSRETRLGILSVIVIGASIWGYQFIKGRNLLFAQQIFYADYEHVGQMQPSTPVYNRGYQIGTVIDIYPKEGDATLVTGEMEIGKRYKIPVNAVAEINQSVMGDKTVEIVFDKPCNGNDCAETQSYLKGVTRSIANTILQPDELKVYMKEVSTGLKEVTKELKKMSNDPDSPVAKSMVDLQATLSNLRSTTALLNQDLRRNGKIHNILANAEDVTGSIDTNRVQSMLANVGTITDNLKAIDLSALSDQTSKTITDAQSAIQQLTETVKGAEGAITEFNTLLAKINKGEGSLGKLANDEALYDELKAAAEKTKILMHDFQQRPDRYIPLKSSRKVKKIDRKRPMVLPEEGKN